MDFVSLHNYTDYSILSALTTPKELFEKAKELGQKAIAITDRATLAGSWDGLKASKSSGVKLIQGVEFYFLNDVQNKNDRLRHLVLLATNHQGYKNLLKLNRNGYNNGINTGNKIIPVIDWKLLEEFSEGLICLTSGGNGILANLIMNKKFNDAEEQLKKLINIFEDRLGLEVQPHALKRTANNYVDAIDQQTINFNIIRLAKKYNVRIVPTTNSMYVNKTDAETHDVLLAIGAKQPTYSNARVKYDTPEFYIKTGQEVYDFFVRNWKDDAEKFMENTIYFADMCEEAEWIDPKFSNPSGKELPVFPVKNEPCYNEFKSWINNQDDKIKQLDEDKAYLRFKCYSKLEEMKLSLSSEKYKIYLNRTIEELEVLEYQGFSSYILIVADYAYWCKQNCNTITPGRGSAAGCLVGFLLDIHTADSIKYDLLFERFQNKFKTSMPDIDYDIGGNDRDKLLAYLRNKYGENKVCMISNINTITPKVYLRDLARSCQFGGSREEAVRVGDDLASFVSKDLEKTKKIDDIGSSPLISEYNKKYPQIMKCGKILSKPRAVSQHAAGLIISNRDLTDIAPLRMDPDGTVIIEFHKETVEETSFVKMDILGVSTLDTISSIVDKVKKLNPNYNNDHIDYDSNDKLTYALISSGNNYGIFQFGKSSGAMDLCRKVKPKTMDDLAIITTLVRPAAANIRTEFIAAKEGKKKVLLLHPSLNNAFKKTYGYGLFDESILQLGKDVAGWDLNTADRIRKMIKEKGKNPEKDAKLRSEFIQDAMKAQNITEEQATEIWEVEVGKFASYTFNKSHAICYSMLSYQTAYLKAHYPIEFLLTNLEVQVKSLAPDAENNIKKIKQELRSHGIKILPPDLNKSQTKFSLNGNDLITGLDALKFVGDDAIKDIIEKRPFKDFTDFMARVDSRKVKANTIQALASSGCLDIFGFSRKSMFLYCSDFRKKLQIWKKKHDHLKEDFKYPWVEEKDWTLQEKYALEKHYLGEAFICQKKDAFGKFFHEGKYMAIKDIKQLPNKTLIPSIKAEVKNVFEFRVKKETSKLYGQTMAKVDVEDEFGDICSITLFPDRWQAVKDRIKLLGGNRAVFEEGIAINFSAYVNIYEDETGLILENIFAFRPPPAKPSDLKAKKVSIKKTIEDKSPKEANSEELFENIEDQLYNDGVLDFPDEEN